MHEKSYLSLNATGFHRVAYTEWGRAGGNRTLVCVHGLTRVGRDFDAFADVLSADFRVACPDVVGRGRSDWLADKSAYSYPQYLADMTALIARLDVEAVDWIGTSMGGLIGMLMAATPGSPIRRLVINDVGPFVPKAALQRIATYVGTGSGFADTDAVEAYLRDIHAPFGALTDAQWGHLAEHSVRKAQAGGVALHYDSGIAEAFRATPVEEIQDLDLWAVWDKIECPVLVLRGAQSDLLLAETASEMAQRGPKAKVVEFEACGHAPMLMDPGQIAPVREWLLAAE